MTDPQSQPSAPMLHFLCGKIGAGKSTLAAALASQPGALRISEDDWLAALYPGEIHGMDDYVRCAGRLRAVVAPHVRALLDAGLTVVLDFPANTRRSVHGCASWRRRRGASTGCISWMCRTRSAAPARAQRIRPASVHDQRGTVRRHHVILRGARGR